MNNEPLDRIETVASRIPHVPHPRSLVMAIVFVRIALAAGFLSAVADRFGLWGPIGTHRVAWGSFDAFIKYTGQMLFYLPARLVPIVGWIATIAEVTVAVGLLVGVRLREFAFGSGVLLTLFAISMTLAFGVEAPLSYSVWSAASASFLLASLSSAPRGSSRVA